MMSFASRRLVALAVRLHDRVLDAVVDHLRVVARADAAGVREALFARTLGAQCVEDGHRELDVLGSTAGHEAVAVVLAPDTARDAHVHVADALGSELLGVDGVVDPLRVATVDDEVALAEHAGQVGDHVMGDLAVRDHDPHETLAVGEGFCQGAEVGDVRDGGVGVVPDDVDPCVAQTRTHVVAHLPEADKTDLHDFLFFVDVALMLVSTRQRWMAVAASAAAGWAAAGTGTRPWQVPLARTAR